MSAVLAFIESNGLMFSALIAAFAYAYKTRIEGKQSIRHVLFLLMQVRVALVASKNEVQKGTAGSLDSVIGQLEGLGLEVDDELQQLNRAEAEKFGASLEERFLQLDGESFTTAVARATTDLSKRDPFLANQITFLSRVPSAIDSLREYVASVKEVSAQLSDQELPDYAIENTRVVCQKYLDKRCNAITDSLCSDVDAALLELAEKSGFKYKKKVKSLIDRWDSEGPDEDPFDQLELESDLKSMLEEIAELNKKSQQRADEAKTA